MGKTAGKIQHVPFILPQKLRKVLTKVGAGGGGGNKTQHCKFNTQCICIQSTSPG